MVTQRFFVVIKAEMVFDDIKDLLHHPGDVQGVMHLVVQLGVDQMQGDETGLVLR
ncbi:hypothetical protein D3C79_931520 [compost metagenome]